MIIGIDTGSSGAACAMNRRGDAIGVFDFEKGNAAEFASWLRAIIAKRYMAGDAPVAYVERLTFGAFSRGGKASIATQGGFYAGPQWTLDALGIETHLVDPREWQSMFTNLPHGKGKEAYDARKRAIRDTVEAMMRGTRCDTRITLGNCDAIAIAEWGRVKEYGR